jgi:predicted PurR-regulated permease PerM
VAYVLARGIADISSVLIIIGLSLFLAIGLNPILVSLVNRGLPRGLSVLIVILGFIVVIAAFVLAAVGPLSHEIQTIVKNYPRYKSNIAHGKGWAGKLAVKLHLTSYLKGKQKLKIPYGGILGAGKVLLSLGIATISTVALTIYFLIVLPGVKKL